MSEHAHWLSFARWTPLAILTDLDGTLIPFAATPEGARPGPELVGLLTELASSPGLLVAVVSGRPRESLEAFFPSSPGLLLVAEHGGWRRDGAWQPAVEAAQEEVDDLTFALRRLAALHRGALVERKTWSVAFHFRNISGESRDGAVVEVEHLVADWLRTHARFEELRGAEVLEVRPARMDKASAVAWLRERTSARARLLVLGDDVTDEDMFRDLLAGDESVMVGAEGGRATAAGWRLDAPADAVGFLRWLLAVRRGETTDEAATRPRRIETHAADPAAPSPYRLLVVSNRLPELRSAADSFDVRKQNVGGLVSALGPALKARHGLWLGWSGRIQARADPTRFGLDQEAEPARAWVDFPEEWHSRYYNGLCNGALWPVLHSFPGRVRLSDQDWEAYRQVNQAFASVAVRLVGPKDTIWLHDYHLLLLAQRLRERGHEGPIGLFMHVPFPGPDVFFILPWAEEILTALLALDLIGFHTPDYVANLRQCLATLPGVAVGDDAVEHRGHRTHIGAFPIGIIPEGFQEPAAPSAADDVASLMRAISPSRLVLGVDRLDYTKGIPERLEAFARLLELYPEWRRQVSLVQISVPSRSDVPAYAEQRQRVEAIVGHTNGLFGDGAWVPIRYLYRSFGTAQLSLLYRASSIGYVTPLRDGMNLVAKEWVAAQDPDDPGVLVLSRFAGAAVELTDAVLTNPWHIDGLARDLDRALRMGLEERRVRHRKLLDVVSRTTALTWSEDFLQVLAQAGGAAEARELT